MTYKKSLQILKEWGFYIKIEVIEKQENCHEKK